MRAQLDVAFARLGCGGTFGAVDTAPGPAVLIASLAQLGGMRATADRTHAPEPTQEPLEELAVAQPADPAEEQHAGHAEDRVARHEASHGAGRIAARQHQLRPQRHEEERDRRPARERARVAQAEVGAPAERVGKPLDSRVQRAERRERRPGVTDDRSAQR